MCRGYRITGPVLLRVIFLDQLIPVTASMSRVRAVVGLRYFLTGRSNKLRLAGLTVVGADVGTSAFSKQHVSA
jgi:hypothetical protein